MSQVNLTREVVAQKLQDIQPLPAEEEFSLQDLSPMEAAYLRSAAVMSYFDPAQIRPAGSRKADDPLAKADMLAYCRQVPDDQGRARWILLNQVRVAVLQEMGTQAALRKALRSNPERPQDALQQMLDAYILGEAPPVEQQTRQQLAANLQVVDWLAGLVPDLPSSEALARAHAWAELLQPFRYLVGENFVGRQKELAEIQDFVFGETPAESGRGRYAGLHPMLIYGPGGMGKSTLLSRFILDHCVQGDPGERLAFVYLDFDRANLLPEEPLTLLLEAVRQLGVLYPQIVGKSETVSMSWQRRLAEMQDQQRVLLTKGATRTSRVARGSEGFSVVRSFSDRTIRKIFLDEFADLWLDISHDEHRPLLFILDTFEEVQYLSRDYAEEVWEFLLELSSRLRALRPLVSGRAMVSEPRVRKAIIQLCELHLQELDEDAARAFLAARVVSVSQLAGRVLELVGGNPLSLKLAAASLSQEGKGEDLLADLNAQVRAGALRVDDGLIQGQLYRRILSHIHNTEVRKLAHPGLALRWVTPELILEVMAEPCGVKIEGLEHARQLFEELSREVSLVAKEGPQMLRHRTDVRRIMLSSLHLDEPQRVQEIHRRAIEYFAAQPEGDLRARAEEIYHLLWFGVTFDQIDRRWLPGIESYLRDAVEELPRPKQAYLASRLGLTGDQFQWDAASLSDWERHAETRALDLSNLGKPEEALAVLAERRERTPESSLYRVEAQILANLNRWPEARRVAREGLLWAIRTENQENSLDLSLLAARVEEQLGHYSQAQEMLDSAEKAEVKLGSADRDLLDLEIAVQRLRLKRLDPGSSPFDDTGLKENAYRLFEKAIYSGLRERPDLVLNFLEEVGVDYPHELSRVLELLRRPPPPTPAQQEVLAYALAAWDKKASGVALATGGYGKIKTWDAEAAAKIFHELSDPRGSIKSISVSPDGRQLLTIDDKMVRVSDVESGQTLFTKDFVPYGGHFIVNHAAFSLDGQRIAAATQKGEVRIWSAGTGEELMTLGGGFSSVDEVAFSPDGRRIVAAGAAGTARVWDAQSGEDLMELSGHDSGVFGVAVSPDGRRIATADRKGIVHLWDAESGEAVFAIETGGVQLDVVVFSLDGQRLLSSSREKSYLIDVETGKLSFETSGTAGVMAAQAFSSDGKQIILSYHAAARVIDAESGKILYQLTGHTGYITQSGFSPDGLFAITASRDGTARIWALDHALAGQAGVSAEDDPLQAWLSFVRSKSPSELFASLRELTSVFVPTKEVVRAIVHIAPQPSVSLARVSSELFEKLRSSLFSNFEDRQSLKLMVRLELGEDLDRIAAAEIFHDVLYNLIDWAEANGRLEDLVTAIRKANPQDPNLPDLDSILNRRSAEILGGDRIVASGNVAVSGSFSGSVVAGGNITIITTYLYERFLVPELPLQAPVFAPPDPLKALLDPELLFNWSGRLIIASQAVCLVEGLNGYGTGFLVGPDLLLTASFVLDANEVSENPQNIRFKFDYNLDHTGVPQTGTIYKLAEDWLVDTDQDLLFTMVRLDGVPGEDAVPGRGIRRGWLALGSDEQPVADETVWEIGHSLGGPLKLIKGVFLKTTPISFLINTEINTGMLGMGGAPVLKEGWQVIGIHIGLRATLLRANVNCIPIQHIYARPKVVEAMSAI